MSETAISILRLLPIAAFLLAVGGTAINGVALWDVLRRDRRVGEMANRNPPDRIAILSLRRTVRCGWVLFNVQFVSMLYGAWAMWSSWTIVKHLHGWQEGAIYTIVTAMRGSISVMVSHMTLRDAIDRRAISEALDEINRGTP